MQRKRFSQPFDLPEAFWSLPKEQLFKILDSSEKGLSDRSAQERHKSHGKNTLEFREPSGFFALLLEQFNSPLIYLLLFAGVLSLLLSDSKDGIIIFVIIAVSACLSFIQKKGAVKTINALLAIVETENEVLRDGIRKPISTERIVPGDIVFLEAGQVIPGDCLLLESKDLHLDEAALTGESLSVEKQPATLNAQTPLKLRTNTLYMGTHIICGRAKALVVHIGKKQNLEKFTSI